MDSSHEANTTFQQKDGEEDTDRVRARNVTPAMVSVMDSEGEDIPESSVSGAVNSSLTPELETNKTVTSLPEGSVNLSCQETESYSEKVFEKDDITINDSKIDPEKDDSINDSRIDPGKDDIPINESIVDPCEKKVEGSEETTNDSTINPEKGDGTINDSIIEPEKVDVNKNESIIDSCEKRMEGTEEITNDSIIEPEKGDVNKNESIIEPEKVDVNKNESIIDTCEKRMEGTEEIINDSTIEPEKGNVTINDSTIEPEKGNVTINDSIIEPEKGVVRKNESIIEPEKVGVNKNESIIDPCEKRMEGTEETTKLLETEKKASQDKLMTLNLKEEPVVGDGSKSKGSVDTSNVEGSTSGPCLDLADNMRQPFSPYSDKEVDLSEERVLMIDESEAGHSESAANVSHTSSGILDSDTMDEASTAKETSVDTAEEGTIKDAIPTGVNGPIISSLSSIEESIERCIANYSCESSEDLSDRQSGVHSPTIFPRKKRTVAGSKPAETRKFPYNYGFKIITNKIDLSAAPRGAFNTISKLQEESTSLPSNITVKRIKVQGKSVLDYNAQAVVNEESKKDQDNAGKEALFSKSAANIKIAVGKSSEEPSEKVTPKERPTIGLKVRDVESINAAIRTVKAPPSHVLPEETNNILNSSALEKGSTDDETTSQANDRFVESGPEGISMISKSTLRAIAPKCEPIASNDQQAIKMIRDLIQLPSIPVYVPDVSDSKHFNGRLHLCHGCGDRFVLLKSLLEHQNRRSCVIKFQCLKCDSAVLCFFNRCEFIRHLYNHNQTLTTVMLQYHIAVERLPPQNSGIFDIRICQECKVILKIPLSDHMQSPDPTLKKTIDFALKCQWCSLLLPTRCAYQAHRRMHFLQAPHVCPECGDMSADLPSFNVHINSVCFHTSKRSLFQCTHCKAEMYDARKLERHVRERHIRDVFKCNFCFVACFNLKDLEKHRRHNHQQKVAEEPEDEDKSGLKYAFHLCDMCPNRLIRRVRLGQHVLNHTYSHADITYVYECRKCKANFLSKEVLSSHSASCVAGPTNSNAQAVTSVIRNGTDILVQQPEITDVRVPVACEPHPPVATDSGPLGEVQGDFTETTMIPQQTSYPEEDDDMMVIEGTDLPPPLQRAPTTEQIVQSVTQPVNPPIMTAMISPVTQPSNMDTAVPEKKKKKKKATKKPPIQSAIAYDSPRENFGFNSFEEELFMDGDSLDAGGDAMEVVLNCLECGTNLTSELGSYCTQCEQKREEGDCYQTAAPNPLLIASPKPTLNVAKKKLPKKLPGGNYSCRICNALISKTCDKAAIKRHFISKHKEIFIAALQTGFNAKRNGESLSREQLFSKMSKPSTLSLNRGETAPKEGLATKKSPVASLSKLSPKRKRKKPKKPMSESDTDDDSSYMASSPSREGKKPKEKRKKSYSPAFPVLEQGMVALEEKNSETNESTRTCYKCSFKSVDKEEFMAHVATHKTNRKDVQCPACGMCFVVRPSLEKHLLILHGMQNVDEYLLEHGFPPVAKMTEDVDVDMLDVNQCRVCHLKFDSEALLEKHFRTHGSAFLLSKQFRRSS